MKVKFVDVMKKYDQAKDCMQSNMGIAQEGFDRTILAPWINVPTLARWLYGSSQEFLNDYRALSREYLAQNELVNESTRVLINLQSSILNLFVHDFRTKLLEKFSTSAEVTQALNSREVVEAIA